MSDPYASLTDPFTKHYATVRGQVRAVLAARQLAQHLPALPATVLDLGGGAGHQAIPLARQGYDVVLLDPSRSMLAKAYEALAREPSLVRARVVLCAGSGEDAVALVGSGQFDLVLCHGVIMYLEDPVPLLVAIGEVTKLGGTISLITKNASALAMRAALEGRFGDALRAFGASADVGGMKISTRAHELDQIVRWLGDVDIDLVEWFGIRVFTDHLGGQSPGDDIADILAAEWEAGRRDPYRHVARLLHVLGRKV